MPIIADCRACGRKLCRPKIFCNPNCEKEWNLGFRVEEGYENYFCVTDWIVIAGNDKYPKNSIILQ